MKYLTYNYKIVHKLYVAKFYMNARVVGEGIRSRMNNIDVLSNTP